MKTRILLFLLQIIISNGLVAQYCNSGVPSFTVNLSGNPNSTWISPNVIRNDNCCGTSSPDRCVQFIITLHPGAVGINFSIASGAVPSGAMFYQINCGPPTPVGQPICLSGVGPHYLTFCKPGNNNNTYQITSIPGPVAGTDAIVNDGCIDTLHAVGYNPTTVTWTSIFPGTNGQYNSYLSCTAGCLDPIVTGSGTPPPYVDYLVCGQSLAPCNTNIICDTVRAYFNPTLNVVIVPSNPTICFGQTSTTITAVGSGGYPPYSYLWNNQNPSQTISVGVGTYQVQLTDASGCPPAYAQVTVTAFSVAISANAGSNQIKCSQSPAVTLNGSVTGAAGGIWSGGSGTFNPGNTTLSNVVYTPTAAEVASGTVNLVLTTTGNGTCPPGADTINIQFQPFTGTVVPTSTSVSCFGGSNGSAGVSVTGGSTPYTYTWTTVPTQTTSTANGLGQGTYSVTITDGIGCVFQTTVTITQPTPLAASGTSTNVSCSGGSNGTLSVTATGGTGPYTYSWSPGGQTSSGISGQPAGTYTATVTDSKGCIVSTTLTVTQPTPLSAPLTSTNVSCFGGSNGSAAVNISGGTPLYVYNWSPSGGSSATASGLSQGNYTVTVTDNKGCIITQTVSITQPPLLTATTSVTNETCDYSNNGSATVTVSGGTPAYTYSWQPGGQTGTSITNQQAGTYTVLVTDFRGCPLTVFATITQPTPLALAFFNQTNVSCFGGSNGSISVNISGGTPGYTYSWTPGGTTTASVNNLPAGTYSVTATDSRGCTIQGAVTITQPAAPLAVTAGSTSVSCNGGTNGSINANSSGGTGPYTYTWMPMGQASQNVNNLPAGTYTVIGTDALGCTATNTVSITQPAPIVLTSSGTDATCGSANGSGTVSVAGGFAPYTYSWSPVSSNTTTVSGIPSGSYTVLVTDANNCTASQILNINDIGGPSATIIGVTNVTCYGGSNGTATVSVIGGSGTISYTWTPMGGNGSVATGLPAGTYVVFVSDTNGCQALATTSPGISQPPPIVVTVTTTATSCTGGNNGSASVSASGGTPGFTYIWLPSNASGPTITGLTAGVYTVQATDINNCVQTQTFSITDPAPLTASISATSNVSCFGGNNGTATVAASGGTPFYSYQWAPAGGNGATATGLSAGSYTVNVTDSKGCITTAVAVITQPTLALSATSSATGASCFGGSNGTATITPVGGTPGYGYQWSPSGGTSQTASGLTQGNYVVTVNDANGCVTNVAVVISQGTPITGSMVTIDPSCGLNNGSIISQVSGGTSPYTYTWSPGSVTTANLSGVGPGTYTLLVADAYNCTQTFTASLTNIAGPNLFLVATTSVSCFGGNNGSATISINQGTAPYTINWQPFGGTGLTATGLSAGTYTANVTDGLGCTANVTATIVEPTQVSLFIVSITNALCNGGNTGSATVGASGGAPGYTYTWTPSVSTSASATNLQAGTYTVTGSDQNSCPASITLIITQPAVLSASIGNVSNAICYNGTGSATVTVNGGTAPYSYNWSSTPPQTTPVLSNVPSATYSVNVVDANGCVTQTTVLINQPQPVITTAGVNDTVCVGQAGIVMATASGGSGNYYYTWQPTGIITAGTFTAVANSSATYVVVAYDQFGCAGNPDTVSIIAYQLGPGNLFVGGITPICPGRSTTIYASVTGVTGPITYTWNNNLGSGPGAFVVFPNQPTTYVVSVTNACGSTVTDSIQVLFNPQPTIALVTDTNALCVPGTIYFYDQSLTGNLNDPITSWYWTFGDGTSSTQQNPSHLYTSQGTYSVTLSVATAGGCTSNNAGAPMIIYGYPYPFAAFSVNSTTLNIPYDILICTNQSMGAVTYNWNFGDGGISNATNPQHLYNTVGNFHIQLIATSLAGCPDTAYVDVTTTSDIVFPNVFTPNPNNPNGGSYTIGDLTNDVFFPYTSGVTEYKLQIYNRWGELIFESLELKQGWDGWYRGKLCQQDVYVWKAFVKFNNGKTFNKSGDVTLLR